MKSNHLDMDAVPLIDLFMRDLRLRRAASTASKYEEILRRIDRAMPYGIERATAAELRGWLYQDQWSKATRHLYLAVVRHFYAWACDPDEPWLSHNPSLRLPITKVPEGVPRPVSQAELDLIFATAAEPFLFWFTLAAYAGLRCCEIARLRRHDVTEDRMWVLGKGDKERALPTHPRIWRTVEPLPPGPLALRCDGATAADRHYISSRSSAHFRHLGLPDVTIHRLRHYFATFTLRHCGNLRTVQVLLGHGSPATTARYAQVSSDELRAAVYGLPAA